MVQVRLSEFDYMLYGPFGQSSESFFKGPGKSFFNPVLEIILDYICKEIAELASAYGRPAPGKIGIVNPLCQRGQITDGTKFFEPSDDIAISERVTADVNFSDYTNLRLFGAAIQLAGCKFIGNGVRKLPHLVEATAFFNSLRPSVDGVLVNLLGLVGICGEWAKVQYQFAQQIYTHNGDPSIFHEIACDRAVKTFCELFVEAAVLVWCNDVDIFNSGVS